MELHIFHLEARSAFHFGVRGVGLESTTDHAASDTFFGALCHAVSHSTDDFEAFISGFKNHRPPFLLSGAFPCVWLKDRLIRFYPAPLHMQRYLPDEDFAKKFRKAEWVTQEIFEKLLSPVPQSYFKDLHYAPNLKALMSKTDYEAILKRYPDPKRQDDKKIVPWAIDTVPRVAIDRISNASNIYHAGHLRFAKGNGLWCGFYFPEFSNWAADDIARLLELLGEEGIGGERSGGNGQFTVKDITSLNYTDAGDYFVTLSHYNPQESEMSLPIIDEQVAYDLTLRRGWINNGDMRHKTVRMFTAGSILKYHPEQQLYGRMIDVKPEMYRNEIWRYGFALPIRVQL